MRNTIRPAVAGDVERLMAIFDRARDYMRSTGNANQWINGYPQRELIVKEIEAAHCFVCVNKEGTVVATFCFIKGEDPTYAYIEDGEWPSNEPYAVIHRLASDGSQQGIAAECLEWCEQQIDCLRADTHADNKIMQHLLEKQGFQRCGIIYVANGTPRIAYQKSIKRLQKDSNMILG